MKSPITRRPLTCLLLTLSMCLLFAWTTSAWGLPPIKLEDPRIQKVVYCSAAGAPAMNPAAEAGLMEWCIKACQIHGYDQQTGLDLIDVADFSESPKLSQKHWPAARKVTPTECLPYRPFVAINKTQKDCFTYGGRLRAAGFLADFSGLDLSLMVQRPSCIRADPKDPVRRRAAKDLNSLMLRVSRRELLEYKKRIGQHVVVTGRLVYRTRGDTVSYDLVDVKLIEAKELRDFQPIGVAKSDLKTVSLP
jgi:hypothetical protein